MSQVTYVPNIVDDMSQKQDAKWQLNMKWTWNVLQKVPALLCH